jgi:hypothetical protein
VTDAEETYAAAVENWHGTTGHLLVQAQRVIRLRTLAMFPSASEIIVEGDDESVRLVSVIAYQMHGEDFSRDVIADEDDEDPFAEFEALRDELEDPLRWLHELADDDWQGRNTIEMQES